MISIERLREVRLNSSELASILTDGLTNENFDYQRAGDWMDDHIVLCVQVVIMYFTAIFSLKQFMKNREPFKLKKPLAAWNAIVAVLSGFCVAVMLNEYVSTILTEGVNGTMCFTQDQFFGGKRIGMAVFVLILARLPELVDTFFIVLRKQPLLFIHYYHHTMTLNTLWYTYSSRFAGTVHIIFVNALIHTIMYSYYFLTTLGVKPHPLIAKSITIGQIVQFLYAMYGLIYVTVFHFMLGEPCHIGRPAFLAQWVMVTSYTYLFVDFYLNKYKGVKEAREAEKKDYAMKEEQAKKVE